MTPEREQAAEEWLKTYAISEEEEIAWLRLWSKRHKDDARRIASNEWPQPLRISLNDPRTPEFIDRAEEESYRTGFLYGWIEARRLMLDLYRKGFVRPTEIVNIIYEHEIILRRWRVSASYETPLKRHGEPLPKCESWLTIRSKVLKRDGNECTQCGSKELLEIHHLIPVAEGGTPIVQNLVTLCRKCHRGCESPLPKGPGEASS